MTRTLLIAALAILSCCQSTSAEDSEGVAFLRKHYVQLLKFKDSATFKDVGFGTGGPHNRWLTDLESVRKTNNYERNERIALGDLLNLGMEFLKTHGAENDYTKFARKEIEKVIGPDVMETAAEVHQEKGKTLDKGDQDEKRRTATFRDASGTFSVVAIFKGISNGVITLQRVDDDREIKVPKEKLAADSQKWINDYIAETRK